MTKTGIIGFTALLVLLCTHATRATELLSLQSPAVYDNPEVIPRNIFTKCTDLPRTVSHALGELILKDRYAKLRGVKEIDSSATGKALGLRILSVAGRGGGGSTGAKYLSLRANLYQDGSMVAWRAFSLNKEASFHDAGTCRILNQAANQLAGDIMRWMQQSQGRYQLNAKLTNDFPAIEDTAAMKQLDPDDTANISEITRIHLPRISEYEASQAPALNLMKTCGLDSKTGELMLSTFANRLRNVVAIDGGAPDGLTLRYKISTSDNVDANQDENGTLTMKAELWRNNSIVDTYSDTFVPRKPNQKWRWVQADGANAQNACEALGVATKYLAAHTYRWYRSRFNSIVKDAD